jgi:sterol desaturase/sphingolipid hydroxylase (fatty acid hydroxylase superfamily)
MAQAVLNKITYIPPEPLRQTKKRWDWKRMTKNIVFAVVVVVAAGICVLPFVIWLMP